MGKEVDLTQPQTPQEGTTAIVIKRQDGSERIAIRDKGGKFARKSRPMPDGTEFKRMGRKALMKLEAGPDGKMTRSSRTKAQAIIDNMIHYATYRHEEVDKDGNTRAPDPKMVAASKQCADWVWLNFIGKPSETDEDKEDNKLSGIKFVVIQQPELMNNQAMNIEDRQRQLDKPSFIDAEVVSTDDPKDPNAT